eukprot:364480-Chlamydomonas_euryale.AAC.21
MSSCRTVPQTGETGSALRPPLTLRRASDDGYPRGVAVNNVRGTCHGRHARAADRVRVADVAARVPRGSTRLCVPCKPPPHTAPLVWMLSTLGREAQ